MGVVVSIPSFIDFWTLKVSTGVMGFIFSWFKDWYLWAEKQSRRDFPLYPTSALKSHQLFLLWSVTGVTQLSGWKYCLLLKGAAGECQEDFPLTKAALGHSSTYIVKDPFALLL